MGCDNYGSPGKPEDDGTKGPFISRIQSPLDNALFFSGTELANFYDQYIFHKKIFV